MKQVWLVVLFFLLHWHTKAQVIPLDNMWMTNGTVLCSEMVGDTLYIGGSFTHVGPQNYNGVILDIATGQPLKTNMHPDRVVRSVVPDGQGGWILGGEFFRFGRTDFRRGLARLNADGSLHPWNPFVNGDVLKIIRVQDTLFVAGSFNSVNEEPRKRLAAFKISTGELLPWNPNPDGEVFDLDYYNGEVIAGGNFTQIADVARSGLAALHPVTAQAAPWNPVLIQPFATPVVNNLSVHNNLLFVSGYFEKIEGLDRMKLAAINMETKGVTPWNPQPNNTVESIIVEGSKIFVGGGFTEIGGKARRGLARLNNTNGQADDWDPITGPETPYFYSLLMHENRLLVGGVFSNVKDSARHGLVALHPDEGNVMAWNPNAAPGGYVLDIVLQGDELFIAGNYQGIGGKNRYFLAGINLPEGHANEFKPVMDGTIWSMTHENDTLYAGGEFQKANGTSRSNLAAFNTKTGLLMPWSPGTNGVVFALASHGAHVYAGGEFSFIGASNRNNLGQILKSNGTATPWNPQPDNVVRALATTQDYVYAGGRFNEIGGQTRRSLAALPHTGNGIPTDWNPNPNVGSNVLSFLRTIGKLYVGGTFQQMAGVTRTSLALFDLPAHTLNEEFKPNFNGNVNALALQGNTLYAGGQFTSNFNLGNNDLAALNASVGTFLPWNPSGPLNVFTLQQRPESIIAGGFFSSIASRRVNNLAALQPDLTLPLRNLTLQAALHQKQVLVHWQANEEDDVLRYHVERSLNGRDFTQIAMQYPTGTAQHSHSDVLLSEKQYYRVKAMLKDGRFFTSNTSMVIGIPLGNGRIFPNPGNGNYLYYQPGFLQPEIYQVVLINALGQQISTAQLQGGANQVVALPVQGLPAGIYKVLVLNKNGKMVDDLSWLRQ